MQQRVVSPTELFCSDAGTPAFHLLAWVGEACGHSTSDEPLLEAAEAMGTLYFAVRCQDDIVDAASNPLWIYLGQALSDRTLSLLFHASGEPSAMMEAWEDINHDFLVAAAVDAQLRTDPAAAWDREAIHMQGRKFLPMTIPLVAVLLRAGRPDDLGAVRAAVECLGIALQLTNDLNGAYTDLDACLGSPFLSHIGVRVGDHDRSDLASTICRAADSGKLAAYRSTIEASLQASLVPAGELPGTCFSRMVTRRMDTLDEVFRRIVLRSLASEA